MMSNRPERLKASPLPLILSIVALLASAVLAALPALRLISNTNPLTSIIGWLLTPVATFVLYGLDFRFQTSPFNHRNFVMKPIFTFVLRIVAFASLLLLFPHILRLAQIWSVVNN
jgi:hypothetical protein